MYKSQKEEEKEEETKETECVASKSLQKGDCSSKIMLVEFRVRSFVVVISKEKVAGWVFRERN